MFDLQQLPETEDLFLWKQFTTADRVNQNRKCTVNPNKELQEAENLHLTTTDGSVYPTLITAVFTVVIADIYKS